MKRRQLAFTLVETIVAVTILSIVLTMVYSVFYSVARSTVAGAVAAEEVQRQRIALKTIEDALSGLVYYEGNKEEYSFLADTEIFEYPSISFVSRVPPDFLGNNEFGSQRLRRITFQVEDDEDFGKSLVMYQSTLMQPEGTEDMVDPNRWVLGPNLDTCFFLFWSTINNEWVNEWTETNSVPTRVKFELALKGSDGEAANIEDIQKREIVVFSQSITQSMQNPPLPAAKGGGARGGKGNGGRPTSGGRPKPTPEQIAEWRKRQASRSGRDGNDGRSRYSDAQRDAYKRRMADYARRQAQANGGATSTPNTTVDITNGQINNPLLNDGASSNSNSQNSGGIGVGIPGMTTLNDALIDYESLNGRPASSLQELVDDGFLTSIPNPPSGTAWVLNEDGTVGYQRL